MLHLDYARCVHTACPVADTCARHLKGDVPGHHWVATFTPASDGCDDYIPIYRPTAAKEV